LVNDHGNDFEINKELNSIKINHHCIISRIKTYQHAVVFSNINGFKTKTSMFHLKWIMFKSIFVKFEKVLKVEAPQIIITH
jgi:hypothetical protein